MKISFVLFENEQFWSKTQFELEAFWELRMCLDDECPQEASPNC